MELLVCIKQVPDDSVSVSLGADGAPKLDEIAPVVNAFDTYALEMAARFKEAHGGSVTVLTIGGDATVPALRSCLSVGADHAYKLAEESACDTQGIAYLLSKASAKAGEQPFDVIFCGSESTDASSGQVGAQLAEILGIPVVTNVLAVEPRGGRRHAEAGDRRGIPRGGGALPLRCDHRQAQLRAPLPLHQEQDGGPEDAHRRPDGCRCGSRCRSVRPRGRQGAARGHLRSAPASKRCEDPGEGSR